MIADETFAVYSIQSTFDEALIENLVSAIASPKSSALAQIIKLGAHNGKREFYGTDEFKSLQQAGIEESEALFRSEALERMVILNMFSDRFTLRSERIASLGYLSEHLKWAAKTYRPLDVIWDWPSIERIVRSHVHASETISASNALSFLANYYDAATIIESASSPDSETIRRLEFQQTRLERAEHVTRETDRCGAYFHPRDMVLLQKLFDLTGRPSVTLSRADNERAIIARARREMIKSVSPEWRNLLNALFEAEHPKTKGAREGEEQAVLNLPEFAPIAKLSPELRGRVLFEAAQLQHKIVGMRRRNVELSPGLKIGTGSGEIGRLEVGGFLGGLATILLGDLVRCDDTTMAALIDYASEWRPLCQTGLLDSAEITLASGSAHATEAALLRLAERPSHCFIPSRDYGDYEGDAWWQDTPGRVTKMLMNYDKTKPRGKRLFGKRGFGKRKPDKED